MQSWMFSIITPVFRVTLRSLWFPLIVTRGHHHRSIDFSLRTLFPIILYQDSASSPDAHLWDYLSHTYTHHEVLYCPGWHFWAFSSFSVGSLCFDWYLSAFWPSCLPWYSALVSPLISLLPLLTTACMTVLTLIKAANGFPLCWLIITEDFAKTRSSSCLQTLYWSLCSGQRAGRSSTTASRPLVSHGGDGNDFTSITVHVSVFCYNAPCLSHNNLCYIPLKKVVFLFYALSWLVKH